MGENGISISDTKQVKVSVFEDEDLISDEEKAAMAEDIDGDPDNDKAAVAKAAADKEAQEEADAKKEEDESKLAEDAAAREKAETDKKEADAAAAAIAKTDEEAKAGSEAGSKDGADKPIVVPQTAPPVSMQTMSVEEIATVQTALEDAKKRFQDGEIDYEKYYEERNALDKQLWMNDVAVQMSVDGVESQWQWEQQSFLAADENKWINDDDVVYAALSATVNRIMSTPEGAVMPGTELLAQAREEVAARFSPTQAQDTETAAEKRAKEDALKRAKAKEAGKPIPETLGGAPAADLEEGSGEFDYLDKLDGEAYEKAVEGLSEVQLARYEGAV